MRDERSVFDCAPLAGGGSTQAAAPARITTAQQMASGGRGGRYFLGLEYRILGVCVDKQKSVASAPPSLTCERQRFFFVVIRDCLQRVQLDARTVGSGFGHQENRDATILRPDSPPSLRVPTRQAEDTRC